MFLWCLRGYYRLIAVAVQRFGEWPAVACCLLAPPKTAALSPSWLILELDKEQCGIYERRFVGSFGFTGTRQWKDCGANRKRRWLFPFPRGVGFDGAETRAVALRWHGRRRSRTATLRG